MKKHTIHYILLVIILIIGIIPFYNHYQEFKKSGAYCNPSSHHFEKTHMHNKKVRICVENANYNLPLCEFSDNHLVYETNCRRWK